MSTNTGEVRFPINTRIPKDTNVVVFTGDNMKQALERVTWFSPMQRILSVQDILKLKLQHTRETKVWRTHATAATTEFFGLDANGTPVLAWLPDLGPIKDLAGFVATQTLNLKAKNHGNTLETMVISRETFLEILEGKYGECYTCTFAEALAETANIKNFNPHNEGYMTFNEAVNSKVLRGRLGGYTTSATKCFVEFLDHLWVQMQPDSISWEFSKDVNDVIQCTMIYYHDRFSTFVDAEPTYSWTFDASKSVIDLEAYATVCLTHIGTLQHSNAVPMKLCITILGDVEMPDFWTVYDNNEPYVKSNGNLCIYNVKAHLYSKNLPKLFIENTQPPRDHVQIVDLYDTFYTIEPRKTLLYDAHQFYFHPECLVKSLHVVHERKITTVNVGDYTANPPDMKAIEDSCSVEWNFFSLWSKKVEENSTTWKIKYYCGKYYDDRIIAKEKDIVSNMGLLGRIV